MYADHVPQIAAGMRADPETFIRGCLFAVCSIKQPVIRVPDMLLEIDRKGEDATALFSHKFEAYCYLQAHGTRLWKDTLAASTVREGLMILCGVPGLGLVKSAFVLQFLGRDVGCLDSRNMAREGIDPRLFRWKRPTARTPSKVAPWRLEKYLELAQGRAQELWDRWCVEVADYYDRTPQEISELHLAVIN